MLKLILRKSRGAIVLAFIALVPIALVLLLDTWLLQNYGTGTRNTLKYIACILAAAAWAFAIVKIIASAAKASSEAKQKSQTERELEALKEKKAQAERRAKAKLSVREPLKDTVIYERLKSWLNEDWGRMTVAGIPAIIEDILRQMDDMNMYQSKLSRLITNNGADYLEDTNAVLESVEQCILKKVRKVLNCFVVYESSRAEDIEKMKTLLEETRASNELQLNNVKEFLLAITDYLNKQGEDDSGIEKLNIYKRTILESVRDPE